MLKYGVYDLLTQLFEEPGACQQVLEQVQGVADAGDETA
jgi:hypothetical protein